MRAIIRSRYGPPEVLQLKEVEKPVPTEGQVLVKIRAASANPLDWHSMRGAPFIARLGGEGLRKPKDPRLGTDIAGKVEAVGKNVTRFHPGEEVFGTSPGGFAEYASPREDRLVLKPTNLSFEEAAAVPVAAITALQGLRDKGKIQAGQRVLINGASGGVGSFAVQIAKSFGADVTGVCSTRNLDMVRSIGADRVIDYTQKDFAENGQSYDLVLDAVGNRSISDYKRVLKPGGFCVIAGFAGLSHLFEYALLGPLRSKTGNKKVGLMMATLNEPDLTFLRSLLETGRVRPVIDRRYPLSETAEAIRYLEGGHARGKVVITMEDSTQ
jgi:NADPH:quinone reductase-like Zn-dependent oxidoreductase